MPDNIVLKTAGTEFATNCIKGDVKFFADARVGNWIIFPAKSWHRPGLLQTKDDRYIVAADMEI